MMREWRALQSFPDNDTVSQVPTIGADECTHCSRPPSKLHDLALEGDAGALSAWLATDDGKASSLDAPDSYGFTPLQLATDRGEHTVPPSVVLSILPLKD